ncbi:MAG TPA: SusC/RagA family TonB-linked outer membrane protein [Gemmatimonadales bacterium]|nr:SusC/RagA family TonB-linked outer membrane protein [Gemmatimonadales bacterium]
MRLGRLIGGALLLGSASLSAQATGTIRGHVVSNDVNHAALAGVTVSAGSHRTVTLSDGSYLLLGVPAGADSVRARIIGYGPQSKAYSLQGNDTAQVDFALEPQAVTLAEVVAIGYGTARAGDVTGSQKQVGTADFNPGAVVSPQNLMEDKVSGVQVVDNNQPGGGLSIRIRGTASINASSEPLYVVDGVPLGTGSGGGVSAGNDPLNFLNPNDIESITILKDAASAAIYGSNASNGVVLITTKSGQGQAHVTYGGSYMSSSVTRVPSMLNASQFAAAVAQYAPAAVPQLGTSNTNWFDLIDRTGTGQSHNLALAGSGATSNYRLSLGYLNQDGIIQGSSTQQIQLGVNYNQRLYNDRLSLHTTLQGARSYDTFAPGGVLSNAAQMGPTQPEFDGTSATGYYNWPGNSLTSADNPVEILNNALDHGTTYRSVGNVEAKYDFSNWNALRGLTATARVGYDVTYADRVSFYANNIHQQTKNGTDGSYFEGQSQQANTLLETFLDYQPPVSVGPGNFDFTGGYSYSQSHSRYPTTSATQLSTNALGDAGIPQAGTILTSVDLEDSKLISFFGRAGYNINDRYLVSASIRRDGSSRFGPGNQWGNFPAASVGWRISQEPFMQSIGAISDLKLRGSWGKTGNQSFGNYLFDPTFTACNATAEAQLGNQFVCPFRPSAVDPNLKWESTTTWDFGADYALFGSRFSGSIDWYNKKTDGLLFTIPIDPASNLSNFLLTNIGSMKNTGFDFDITARLLDAAPNGGLSWNTSFNVSHNVNTLTSINPNVPGTGSQIPTGGIAGGVGSTVQILEPGQPINSFYVCRQVYQNGKPEEGHYLTLAGADTTGCAIGANTVAEHDPAPHWIFGFTSNMTFHRFDFSFTLRAWLGNYVYNNVASNVGDYRELTDGSSPYNLSTSVLATGFKTQQLLSDYYVENGSFLRMDNIMVGYTFPFQAQRLRVYALIQNAFTITGYSGVDPTAGLNGIDNNIYPRSRTFTGGLDVQF